MTDETWNLPVNQVSIEGTPRKVMAIKSVPLGRMNSTARLKGSGDCSGISEEDSACTPHDGRNHNIQ